MAAVLLGPSAKQFEVIQSELDENEDRLEGNVEDLKNWCASEPHLPDIKDSQLLRVFLRGCRHDVSRVRRKLERFCRARASSTDFYEDRQLTSDHIQNVLHYVDIVALPRLTEDGCRVTIFRFKNTNEDSSLNIVHLLKYIFLLVDARIHDESAISGDVFVWDAAGARAALVARVLACARDVRRAVHLAHAAYPQRLKRLYLVNTAPFMTSAINLLRSLLKEKIRNRFMILPSLESLHEHITRDILPADYGGQEANMASLVDRWHRRIASLDQYLTSLGRLKAVGERRDESVSQDGLFGTEGAFRSLNID